MGLFVSYIFYILYCANTLAAIVTYLRRDYRAFLLFFFILLHINVTSFSSFAIAWTGSYLVIIIICLSELVTIILRYGSISYRIFTKQKNWFFIFAMFFVSFFFIVIRQILSLVGILDYITLDVLSRSIKSLLRYSSEFFGFFIISNKIAKSKSVNFNYILQGLSISSVVPIFFVFYQTFITSSPMFLLHNNKTFRKESEVIDYLGQRAVGLSDESSFFAYLITFAFVAAIWLMHHSNSYRKKTLYFLLIILQVLSVIFSLSRTGLVLMLASLFFYSLIESPKFLFRAIVFLIPVVITFNTLSIWLGLEYSLFERFLSIVNSSEDLSNIQRYGTAIALFDMIFSPNVVLGYGFFNYMYYIEPHFPDIMQVIISPEVEFYPSFNLIVQLFVELGLVLSVLFLIYVLKNHLENKKMHLDVDQKSRLKFHAAIIFTILVSALSFNVFTFSMTFLPIIYASKLSTMRPALMGRLNNNS
jgi:hypothetical protein